MTITTERPNKLKQETTLQGQQMVMAFDGQTAWTINPLMGATRRRPIEGPELDSSRPRPTWTARSSTTRAKGTTVELLGEETVDGVKKPYKLKITRKDGQSQELFLDADTGLEVKAVNEVVQPGPEASRRELLLELPPVGGLTMAHTISQKIMGQDVVFTIDKVEILPEVDDAIFKMPAQIGAFWRGHEGMGT